MFTLDILFQIYNTSLLIRILITDDITNNYEMLNAEPAILQAPGLHQGKLYTILDLNELKIL